MAFSRTGTREWTLWIVAISCGLAFGLAASASAAHAVRELDAESIGQAAGVKASEGADGTVRIAWARTDVAVKVDGVSLRSFAG